MGGRTPNTRAVPICTSILAWAKARDEYFSRQVFRTALQGLDRIMEERPEQYNLLARPLLPMVERIDPALVPEVFWHDVASRLPYGNPRALSGNFPTGLITDVVWYDREVAAALLEPIRARIEQTDPTELATWGEEFMAWSLIDPRAAVARLEKVPIPQEPDVRKANCAARFVVGASLARSRESMRVRQSGRARDHLRRKAGFLRRGVT